MAGNTRPLKDHFIGKPFIKRVIVGNAVKLSGYEYASPCDENKESYFSEYA
jgi:hypothetical protein